MSMVPACWHGDECPWHKRGRCLFKHCLPPPVELTGGEVPVEQQLRDLRRTLQRLAAAVMWRGGKVIPEERIPKHIVENVPVPQIVEDAVTIIPKERISECTSDTNVFEDCESPAGAAHRLSSGRALDEIVEATSASHERVQQRTIEELVQNRNGPVPRFQEENDEVVKLLLAESMPERTVEQIGIMPVPQIQEQIAETTPQERIPERTVVQTVGVPVPQNFDEIVEAGSAPHERVQQRTVEHRDMNECNSEPLSSVLLLMRQRLRSWKRSSRRVPAPHERVQQRTVEQQIVDAADSDCLEDSGTPSDSESDEEAKRPRVWSWRHWGRRQGPRDRWSWARDSWSWR